MAPLSVTYDSKSSTVLHTKNASNAQRSIINIIKYFLWGVSPWFRVCSLWWKGNVVPPLFRRRIEQCAPEEDCTVVLGVILIQIKIVHFMVFKRESCWWRLVWYDGLLQDSPWTLPGHLFTLYTLWSLFTYRVNE